MKRNKAFYDWFRAELVSQTRDKKRKAVYTSPTECEMVDPVNRCVQKGYFCGGKGRHKSTVSRVCLYAKMKGAELVAIKQSWLAGLNNTVADSS